MTNLFDQLWSVFRGRSMEENKREFLLHLYDKLWENMNAKEERLWTFLSFYGAAIALAFAAGEFVGIEIYALIIILALTTWAVLIITNANWWYYRNLLMVTRIEAQFSEAVKGVVPKRYRNPPFSFDRLYGGSILILVVVAILLIIRVLVQYFGMGSIASPQILLSLCFLYLSFVFSVGYCLIQHESYIRNFYSTAKLDLLEEAEQEKINGERQTRKEIEESLKKPEIDDRRKLCCRRSGLVIVIFVTMFVDVVFAVNAPDQWQIITVAVLLQIIAIFLYIRLARSYLFVGLSSGSLTKSHLAIFEREPSGKGLMGKINFIPLTLTILIILPIGLFAYAMNKSSGVLSLSLISPRRVSETNVVDQLRKIERQIATSQQELLKVQRSSLELQQAVSLQQLKDYLKKTEAEEKYITRIEATKMFLRKSNVENSESENRQKNLVEGITQREN